MPPIKLLLAALSSALISLSGHASELRFSLIKTSQQEVPEAFTLEGGAWGKKVILNHVAVLIEHPKGNLLLDSGLGSQADQQVEADVPWWNKPMISYEPANPARVQLDAANIKVERILLSHVHWDHVSGLADFPDASVLAPQVEIDFSKTAAPPIVLPSQYAHGVKWQPLVFAEQPFMGFAQSYDIYGDGSVVVVPLSGHTPGSTGVFVTLSNSQQYFFTGDASWRLEGFTGPHDKFWLSKKLADNNPVDTHAQLQKVHELMLANPALKVIPSHDESVQRELGYFPTWVEAK